MSREHGDIPCGGVPSFRELREIGATNEILQYAMVVHQMERENMYLDLRPIDNTQIRVTYMLNDIDEQTFKNFLQRQEKYIDKSRDLSNIFEMMANTGGDLLRQYVIDPGRHDEIINLLHKIVDYGNDIFESIRKRYNCRLPRNIYV
jgi:Mor family transcriptional regulator